MISVIIPALNESAHVAAAVRSARDGDDVEVIVVDGGSDDGTGDLARDEGARVLHSDRGRGRQMNRGGAAARGEILLFLHADSVLPRGYAHHVRRTLAIPHTAGGAFSLRVDSRRHVFRIHDAVANFRSRVLQTPYGDQALFLPSSLFRTLGGFPEIPLMEDLELIHRLRGRGQIRIINRPVFTSARRWTEHGPLKMSLLNQLLIVAYRCGADVERLRAWRESGSLLRRI